MHLFLDLTIKPSFYGYGSGEKNRRGLTLVPTRIKGTPSQKWETSGCHCGRKKAYIRIEGEREKEEKWRERQDYFIGDISQTCGEIDSEADEDDVAFGITQGTKTVVLFLAGRVPESQLDKLGRICWERDHCDIVLEYGGDVRLCG
jgi:hypothetical protein